MRKKTIKKKIMVFVLLIAAFLSVCFILSVPLYAAGGLLNDQEQYEYIAVTGWKKYAGYSMIVFALVFSAREGLKIWKEKNKYR